MKKSAPKLPRNKREELTCALTALAGRTVSRGVGSQPELMAVACLLEQVVRVLGELPGPDSASLLNDLTDWARASRVKRRAREAKSNVVRLEDYRARCGRPVA